MTIGAHTISPHPRSRRRAKRVGRGNSSGRGTYSGRGGKGQTARSGGSKRTHIRAFKALLQKVPKLRGFKSNVVKQEVVTLAMLDRKTVAGDPVRPSFLKKKGLIRYGDRGVKILSTGTLNHAILVDGCNASKSAREAIEKAGGSFKK